MDLKTQEDFLREAYLMATFSPDPSSQNGAVIIDDTNGYYELVSSECNHFYSSIEPEVNNREIKYRRIEHAERAAIYEAARDYSLRGKVLVCPWAACADCARAIIGVGLRSLVVHHDRYLITDDRWREQVDESIGWMEKAGVEIISYHGPVRHTPNILVSGRLWSPEKLGYVEHVGA